MADAMPVHTDSQSNGARRQITRRLSDGDAKKAQCRGANPDRRTRAGVQEEQLFTSTPERWVRLAKRHRRGRGPWNRSEQQGKFPVAALERVADEAGPVSRVVQFERDAENSGGSLRGEGLNCPSERDHSGVSVRQAWAG